ncbi:MAG: PAAR domain-containing protein [Methylobacter sp.]|nr:PAAR domain-containing protein [Methylobacter sp.]
MSDANRSGSTCGRAHSASRWNNFLIGNLPAARVTDKLLCVGPPDVIVKGSGTVMINNLPAARMGDMTAHGGTIILGLPTVLIGG